MNGDVKAILSLYRSCLRQIRRLPTEYLRQFFRLRVGDDVRVILDPKHAHLQSTKLKRVRKDLGKLEGANAGYAKCFDYILDTAYGRRGPLRWEILNPLRSEPGVELPPRIIPAVESSRPPFYSREMKALLTSDISVNRALTPAALDHPPTLPPRADPNSPEARALGPFSKRREVNMRWRFFQQKVQKVAFPLQVVLEELPQSGGSASVKTDSASLARVGIRSVGLQDSGVFEEIEALARPPSKDRHSSKNDASSEASSEKPKPTFESHLSTRFLRRRYQQLLSRIPVLSYTLRTTPTGAQVGKYQVKQSPHAVKRYAPVHVTASETDVAWLQLAERSQGKKSR
ncbi:hypothetical protein PYCCODRAFT_1434717 [Trametes coccinea BRFM310]|uniref:LYR motif-containing protein Cup1-like N-terminal domain-containing protein n=1 Tax=Trametes coccinea (strain BRFM310) TaxID=1353009 RepID=A0A1Y2IQ89_TRAC3|nr:hypothetical protein PYCCODRAFT_1434717 [Trametes coccinea BRFM310]